MNIEQFKNAIDENDVLTVKNLIASGFNPALDNNWAIMQSFQKGFYDLTAYLGTLPTVRKALLANQGCLTAEQKNHLITYPTVLSVDKVVEEQSASIGKSGERSEEGSYDESEDSWIVDDDVIEYQEDYDPDQVAEDPAREAWNEGDWKRMIHDMQQGDQALKALLQVKNTRKK